MAHDILGLHHVTATVNDAQADLDFCLNLLGMRLVKKTVNFDNHDVYHFYYGTEHGAPGTIWTTFPYKGYGVPVGSKGAGQVVTTAFSVPAASMAFWRRRLQDARVKVQDLDPRFGDEVIRFDDPSGLWFELVAGDRDSRLPWDGGGVDAAAAIRGLHGVTLLVRQAEPTLALMTDVLGYVVVGQAANRTRLAQRSFMQDILIAASAREVGATIITENVVDFTLIGRHVDIAFVPPWPPAPAV